jgi:hypothetical protein
MSYVHALAANPALATAVTPSLTDPLALVVALGGLGMAVTMFVAALSLRPAARSRGEAIAVEPAQPQATPAIDRRREVEPDWAPDLV